MNTSLPILFAIIFVIVAGILNGSFAFPTKYMSKWQEENIWLVYSLWGFLIIPLLTLLYLSPNVLTIFEYTPAHILWVLFGGGLIFGIGMICFAISFRLLGLGLAFVVNIGIGTAGGAMLPLIIMHPGDILTPFGITEMSGIVLFIIGVIIAAIAGKTRDKNKPATAESRIKVTKHSHIIGIVLCIIAGFASAIEGFTYAYCVPAMKMIGIHYLHIRPLAAINAPWLGIFAAAFIPYFIYFLVLSIKNKSLHNVVRLDTSKYWLWQIVMGIFYFICMIFYSKASMVLGKLGPVIAWPMFMIFIVITSNFWGWQQKEWKACGKKAASLMSVSLLFLIIAVVAFAFAAHIHLSAVL